MIVFSPSQGNNVRVESNLNLDNNKIVNLQDTDNPQDAATRIFVENIIAGYDNTNKNNGSGNGSFSYNINGDPVIRNNENTITAIFQQDSLQ